MRPTSTQRYFSPAAAVHQLEQPPADMLDRYVHIFDDFFLPRHHLEQLVGDPIGIAVEDADPADSVDPAKLLKRKIRERVPGVVLRTTLITGFPTESEADFSERSDIGGESHHKA